MDTHTHLSTHRRGKDLAKLNSNKKTLKFGNKVVSNLHSFEESVDGRGISTGLN